MALGKRRIGDKTELKAVIWLWEKGFEVFANMAGDGPVDLVVISDTGEVILVDVKSSQKYIRANGEVVYNHALLSDIQKARGVKVLLDTEEGFLWEVP